MTPREAFLGPQEVVPFDGAAGRVAAESLAAYPPGIPNVLPGERLTARPSTTSPRASATAATCAAAATAAEDAAGRLGKAGPSAVRQPRAFFASALSETETSPQ